MTDDRPLRVGAVSYLNTKPLVYGLDRVHDSDPARSAWQLVLDLPSRLADGLAAGQLDVALIPSIERFADDAYTVVSDACIACRGPVLSVKLLSRVPCDQIATLALDEGSRTSGALAQILLYRHHGIRPRLSRLPIGGSPTSVTTDAVLLIGDRAIHPPAGPWRETWDLGEQWCHMTGLPFVFAMWTTRHDTPLGKLAQALATARDNGQRHLVEIATAECKAVNMTPDQCLTYLRDNLHFHLGERERLGLHRFYREAVELGLVDEPATAARTERWA